MLSLNYRDSRPIYEQIKDGLCQMMISGALSTGDKLPSVREMASRLAINPNTIQRAYRELETEGYIIAVPGKGSFVADEAVFKSARKVQLLEEFDKFALHLFSVGLSSEELGARLTALEKDVKEND